MTAIYDPPTEHDHRDTTRDLCLEAALCLDRQELASVTRALLNVSEQLHYVASWAWEKLDAPEADSLHRARTGIRRLLDEVFDPR